MSLEVKDQKTDRKTAAPAAAAARPAAAAVDAQKLRGAYAAFNKRMREFLEDMDRAYGKKAPTIGDQRRKLEVFLKTDPARMMVAHAAWPAFNKHRGLIGERKTDVFFVHDIMNMQQGGKLDARALWASASANGQEAMWRACEDFLDLLDDIDQIRKLPLTDDAADAPANTAAAAAGGAQKKSSGPASWQAALDELPAEEAGAGGGGNGTAEWTRDLMTNLKELVGGMGGGDPSVDADFEALLSKLNQPEEDGKSTAADHETLSRIMGHFINSIAPMSQGGDADEDMSHMSEKEKKAEMSRREMESIEANVGIKHVIGKLMSIESLQQTTDPTILENDRKETAAEAERLKNPETTREYTITAHFNHKLLLVLNKLLVVRGGPLPTRTAEGAKVMTVQFPGIKSSLTTLLKRFTDNAGTEDVIRPIGEWVVAHRQQLLNRDDNVFLQPDHPFLVEMKSAKLWATFKPHERINFWALIGHPLQLATIFHHLDNDKLRDIADIVNDLLAAGNIAYDRDPNTLNGKQVITKAIQRGCTQHKIGKIRSLFERMQKEKDQSTLKSLARLMQDVLPQAAGLRRGGKSHAADDDDDQDGDDAQASAASAAGPKVANAFAKLLSNMPPLDAFGAPAAAATASKSAAAPASAASPPAAGSQSS